MLNRLPPPNSMSKPAQFSFAADLFMLQTILKQEANASVAQQLEYLFPWSCYRQVVQWMLSNGRQIGVDDFEKVSTVRESATHAKVVFPNERERDKMHGFFELFNIKRKQAQGVDRSFPPLPDIYQGQSKPNVQAIERYICFIEEAFEGEVRTVEIPAGANWQFHQFEI